LLAKAALPFFTQKSIPEKENSFRLPDRASIQSLTTTSLDAYCKSSGPHVIAMEEAIIGNVNHLSKPAN
jgi:hypothetical protein